MSWSGLFRCITRMLCTLSLNIFLLGENQFSKHVFTLTGSCMLNASEITFSDLVQTESVGKVAPNYVVVDTDYTSFAIVYSCSKVWRSSRGKHVDVLQPTVGHLKKKKKCPLMFFRILVAFDPRTKTCCYPSWGGLQVTHSKITYKLNV